MNWDDDFTDILLRVTDFREFLVCFFRKDLEQRNPKPLSYQRFANLAGFASKGFMADVIAGRKQLTPVSFERTAHALRLNRMWREYLHCLIALENPSFRLNITEESVQKKLLQLKKTIAKKRVVRHFFGDSPVVQVFLRPDFPEVYASLGEPLKGSTFKDIQRRSNIPEASLRTILDELEKVGLVETKSSKYYAVASALDVEELRSAAVFKEGFMRALSKIRRCFDTQANSDASLFMVQTFSISQEQMPTFKKELGRFITDFADQAEDAEGDSVVEICLGMTHNQSD